VLELFLVFNKYVFCSNILPINMSWRRTISIVIRVKRLTRTSKNLWCRLDMSRLLVYIKFDVSPRICIASLFWFYQANIGFVACGSTSPGIYQRIRCTIIIAVRSRLQIWFNSIYPLGFLSLTVIIIIIIILLLIRRISFFLVDLGYEVVVEWEGGQMGTLEG